MGKNFVDTKVSIWTRAHFTDEADMQEIIRQIKKEGLNSAFSDENGYTEYEILYDTEVPIKPENNNGAPTIEVYQGDEVIWDNSNK